MLLHAEIARSRGLPDSSFRLFGESSAILYDEELLGQLVSDVMYSSRSGPGNPDIPAGFTYLGQFIAHDMSHVSAEAKLIDNFEPSLDLGSIYGDGFLDPKICVDCATGKMKVFTYLNAKNELMGLDLPRNKAIAQIPDERNDENLVVGQLHAAWLHIHNLLWIEQSTPEESFNLARKLTIAIYQSMILDDFLEKVCNKNVYQIITSEHYQNLIVRPSELKAQGIPLEVAAAAFRFGHSMVQPTYVLNRIVGGRNLKDLFEMTGKKGLMGSSQVPQNWTLQWDLWFGPKDVNRASYISPRILKTLVGFDDCNTPLPLRTLSRSEVWNLSSGQDVSEKLKDAIRPVYPAMVASMPNYLANDIYVKSEYLTPNAQPPEANILNSETFLNNTPLWYFLLSEAWIEERESNRTKNIEEYTNPSHLGTTGSWLIAETLKGMIEISEFSILRSPNGNAMLAGAKQKLGIDPEKPTRMEDILKL